MEIENFKKQIENMENWDYKGRKPKGHKTHYPITIVNEKTGKELLIGHLKNLTGEDKYGFQYISEQYEVNEQFETHNKTLEYALKWIKNHSEVK